MLINAQGNYDQGRGADGLNAIAPMVRKAYTASRFGAGVPMSDRPLSITGKPTPPASLDPSQVLPRGYRAKPATIAELFKSRLRRQPYMRAMPRTASAKPTPRKRLSKVATTRQRQQFVTWIKNWAPDIYAASKFKADQAEATDGMLGQLAGWWETFSNSVGDLGGKYLQFRTQKEILDAQLERMKQGLPPLQTSEYAPTIAIKPDPGTTREITGAIGAGFGRMLPFIAIGGVALVFLMRKK